VRRWASEPVAGSLYGSRSSAHPQQIRPLCREVAVDQVRCLTAAALHRGVDELASAHAGKRLRFPVCPLGFQASSFALALVNWLRISRT
jgi:hypothetical protein